MLRCVAQRVATAHIHRGSDRLFPSGNAQCFEPHGSRHARRRRKRANIHVRWLKTQRLRCHSSSCHPPFLDYAEIADCSETPKPFLHRILGESPIGNCQVTNPSPRYRLSRALAIKSKLLPVGRCRPASHPINVAGSTPSFSAISRCDRPSTLRAVMRRSGNELAAGKGLCVLISLG